jgi:hypothetical protein
LSSARPSITALFAGKPGPLALFRALRRRIEALGPVTAEATRTQVSFAAAQKFAWIWLAPASRRSPHGTLVLTLDMNHRTSDPLITSASQTYPGKWTHQIPIADAAVSRKVRRAWLKDAYAFGTRRGATGRGKAGTQGATPTAAARSRTRSRTRVRPPTRSRT